MFYKKSHKAFYATRNGRQYRLGTSVEEAKVAEAKLPPVERPPRRMSNKRSNKTEDLIQKFVNRYKNQKTRSYYASTLKALGLPDNPALIRDYHLTRCLDGLTVSGRFNAVKAAKTCFRWLADRGYCQDPFVEVKCPPPPARGDEAIIPNMDAKIAQSVGDEWDILTFMAETGCRPLEARTLTAADINGRKASLIVKRQPRTIYFSDNAYEIVKRRMSVYTEGPADGPIFRQHGEPWTGDDLRAVCSKHGFLPYHLRHTFCTNALLKGVDILTVSILMGHKSLRQVSKTYQHLKMYSGHFQEALAKINGSV